MHVAVNLPDDPKLAERFSKHPHVIVESAPSQIEGVEFAIGSWKRRLLLRREQHGVKGLPELMDNNPLVCADQASVPNPLTTLALIALGPLIRAGILLEPPSILSNIDDDSELNDYLGDEGWLRGADVAFVESLLANAGTAVVIAMIQTPQHESDIDALYEECYSRSFYVRRDEDSEWDVRLVAGKPFAKYRLRISDDDAASLLTIQVLADLDGKCGSAQAVHMFNIMCGFEESLGIED